MTVPLFYLYGEPQRAVDDAFVHVERLDDRSRPNEWTIRPHAHPDLVQLFLIARGGGTMMADDRTIDFDAPALIIVPRATVHGFAWTSDSVGWVLTIACRYLDELVRRYPVFAGLFCSAHAIAISPREAWRLSSEMRRLLRESMWLTPASRVAAEASLLNLLVAATRYGVASNERNAVSPSRAAALVARYRERIDERFRLRENIATHAAALGVSPSVLRTACARIALTSPAAMLDQRAVLEAKRSLLYSDLSVAQIGFSIGFTDPAYFSRFFFRHTKTSPRGFRQK